MPEGSSSLSRYSASVWARGRSRLFGPKADLSNVRSESEAAIRA